MLVLSASFMVGDTGGRERIEGTPRKVDRYQFAISFFRRFAFVGRQNAKPIQFSDVDDSLMAK